MHRLTSLSGMCKSPLGDVLALSELLEAFFGGVLDKQKDLDFGFRQLEMASPAASIVHIVIGSNQYDTFPKFALVFVGSPAHGQTPAMNAAREYR